MNHLDKNMNNTAAPQEKKQWVAPELLEEVVGNTESGPTSFTKETTTRYHS
jgi:hypothetical protein